MPSTWSSWTGAEVCVWPIVPPSGRSGEPGVPGRTSTKKLPSRKIRGRIFSRASRWIGRPFLSIFIVTSVSVESSPSGSTFETLPTSTPAIRTGEFSCSADEFWNTAFIS